MFFSLQRSLLARRSQVQPLLPREGGVGGWVPFQHPAPPPPPTLPTALQHPQTAASGGAERGTELDPRALLKALGWAHPVKLPRFP